MNHIIMNEYKPMCPYKECTCQTSDPLIVVVHMLQLVGTFYALFDAVFEISHTFLDHPVKRHIVTTVNVNSPLERQEM